MAFPYTALAIILVCVFKHSEKLPLGVSVLKKVTAWVLEFGWTPVFGLVKFYYIGTIVFLQSC